MFSHGLKECFQESVTLHGVRHRAMELVLQYAYMGMCAITKADASDLLTTADLLGLIPLREASANFLHKCIDVRSCMQIRHLADIHSCSNLYKRAVDFSRKNFTAIVLQENFLELSIDQVTSYFDDDELQVGREDMVYDAAMRWIRHDQSKRLKYMEQILAMVRLPFVRPEYLKLQVTVDPLLYQSKPCLDKVLEAVNFRESGKLSHGFQKIQSKPRICASKEVLVIFGGVSQRRVKEQEETGFLTAYDPSSGEWRRLREIPELVNFRAYTAVSLGYEIVLTGGIQDNKATNHVIVYCTYLNQWRRIAPLSVARYHHACVHINDSVYAIGGTDGVTCLNSTEAMDMKQVVWKQIPSMPRGVKCPAVAAFKEKIYAFGGFSNRYAICEIVQIYSTTTNTWTCTQSPSVDYACAQATVMSSKIYLLGGSSRNVKIYDPETEEWERGAQMLQKRDGCGVTSVCGKLYVSGGLTQSSGSSLNSVECYCPLTDAWKLVKEMENPRHRHQSVCIRIPIYEQEYSSSVEGS